MTTSRAREVLDRDRDAIRKVLASFGVVEAGVFGSVARHEDTADSDIDLIVHFADGSARDMIRLGEALRTLTGVEIDVVEDTAVFARVGHRGPGIRILQETVPL